jgi:hypothetical protein
MKNSRIILILFITFFVGNISFSQNKNEVNLNTEKVQQQYALKKLELKKSYEAGLISHNKYESEILLANKIYSDYLKNLEQNQNTAFNLNRSIILYPDKDTKVKDITLEVNEKTTIFSLNVACKVKLGNLTIELYDPKGDKQGEFSIESQMDQKLPLNGDDKYEREIIEGNIQKEITNPIKGKWIIRLIPLKTYANVNIQSQLID